MKFYLIRLSIVIVSLFTLNFWDASLTNAALTNAALNGTYLDCQYGNDPNPWASTLEISFDGAGSATGGGKTLPYVVNSDGKLSLGGVYNGIVSADGDIYVYVEETSDDQSIHVGVKKSSGLTNAALNGTYLDCQYGNDLNPWASTLEISFDGAGSATGGGNTFPYVVNSDGMLSLRGVYNGIVSADGDIYVYVEETSDDQSIHVGVKKSSGLTNAALNGTYQQCEFGTDPNPWATVLQTSFDGAGTAAGGDGKTIPYSVDSDGGLNVGGVYSGILSADGSIYVFIDDDDNATGNQSIHIGIKKAKSVNYIELNSNNDESGWYLQTYLALNNINNPIVEYSWNGVSFHPMTYDTWGWYKFYIDNVTDRSGNSPPTYFNDETFTYRVKDGAETFQATGTFNTIRKIDLSKDVTIVKRGVNPIISWTNSDLNISYYRIRVLNESKHLLWEDIFPYEENPTYTINGFTFTRGKNYYIRIEGRQNQDFVNSSGDVDFWFKNLNRSVVLIPYSLKTNSCLPLLLLND